MYLEEHDILAKFPHIDNKVEDNRQNNPQVPKDIFHKK